ncbi:hypothetical protein FV217_15915 [Methylobacterium sp. WL9]|uniref:3',5'-cyclic-nucleotide phosphodiesterase n=1 Tax=Methylobacterium thuringiense TaxID=1003091 RepID=A0ABQ4TSY1_9HYPH|nr:hypothetical protein FV217_15915 [Methylobacterium sp. WL9]GJE57768.1 hypothetical protein EKPJFOCH_4286 [Methylobacterium thuringiense]
MRRIVLATAIAAAVTGAALAQGQPPIQGPEDATCREDARNRLLGAPNPQGLSPFDLGAQLYHECMKRLGAEGVAPKRRD